MVIDVQGMAIGNGWIDPISQVTASVLHAVDLNRAGVQVCVVLQLLLSCVATRALGCASAVHQRFQPGANHSQVQRCEVFPRACGACVALPIAAVEIERVGACHCREHFIFFFFFFSMNELNM